MLKEDRMILLGAAGRNMGKTELSVQLIKKYVDEGQKVIGIKIVTVHDHGNQCPIKDGKCSICSGLKCLYDISEERGTGSKDTMRFRSAGASKVYLVRSFPEGLNVAMEEVLSRVPKGAIIICESNSARNVVEPAVFLMFKDECVAPKPSALAVWDLADIFIDSKSEMDVKRVLKSDLLDIRCSQTKLSQCSDIMERKVAMAGIVK